MPSVSEVLSGTKPPLGAALAQAVKQLSADQQISFSLYHRYVFPLDGMNYWIKVPESATTVATAGTQMQAGMASQTAQAGEAIQIVPGNLGAEDIVGGQLTNPLTATDQGLPAAEPLYYDFTGVAYSHETGTTSALQPGESVAIPPDILGGVWVCAASKGHKFSVTVQVSVETVQLPTTVQVQGSFHYDSTVDQREDATVDSNNVILTALTEIQAFNNIGPDYLYIGTYRNLTFAFGYRGRLYEQADLYHYGGKALFSVNATQIIPDVTTFNPTLIISNSLPIWLNMPNYVPPYPTFNCPIPLFPSYLVTDNLIPPFGSVHIDETHSLQMRPYMGSQSSTAELCKDRVKVHLYGCDSVTASNFLEFVQQYSYDWMYIGFANSPAIKDIKHLQPEFKILAQRKLIEFEVNYLQETARNQARQFIEHVIVQNQLQWLVSKDQPQEL